MMSDLLVVEQLRAWFPTRRGLVRAVDGVSFSLEQGEALGIAGETGSGKSVTARSIMRILPEPPARVSALRLTLEGLDLLNLPRSELKSVWGKKIAMIFQNPVGSLNPLLTIRTQMTDVIRRHERLDRRAATGRALEMLRLVDMPDPAAVLARYPFQLSGGMQQRVMIAMSLSCNPSLLIADEPTTALDVTIQAQILTLLRQLKGRASGLMLITHDLATIAEVCDTVMIMYAGKLMEKGPVRQVLDSPLHPYTKGLLQAIPQPGSVRGLPVMRGSIPSAVAPPPGCRFSPRCPLVRPRCRREEPRWRKVRSRHFVACHRARGGGEGIDHAR